MSSRFASIQNTLQEHIKVNKIPPYPTLREPLRGTRTYKDEQNSNQWWLGVPTDWRPLNKIQWGLVLEIN